MTYNVLSILVFFELYHFNNLTKVMFNLIKVKIFCMYYAK